MSAHTLTDISIKKLKPSPDKQYEVWDKGIPGFGVRISPRGTKSFVLLFRTNGRQRRMTLGRYPFLSLSDARKKARKALSEVDSGNDPADDKRRLRQTSRILEFDGFVEEFIEKYDKPKNRSWRQTEQLLNRVFVSEWGRRDIRQISKSDVLSILDDIVKKGHPSAANQALRKVRKLFNWGVERGIIETSPCQGLKQPAKSERRDHVLDSEELAAVWKAADEMDYPYGHIIKLLILTGQRREEVSGMRWDELDLEKRTWTIASDRNKSDRKHSVPLSPQALQIIQSIPRTNDTLVFPARGGNKPVSGFSKWKKKIDQLSSTSGWTVHDLRRTAATELAGLKVQPHVIERLLNHSTGILGGVAGRYNRFSYLDEMREALDLWANTLDDEITN